MTNKKQRVGFAFILITASVTILWRLFYIPNALYSYQQNSGLSTLNVDCKEDLGVKKKPTKFMSAKEIFKYLHWTNSTSCQLAVDFGFAVIDYNGIAAPDGHKAVCLDQFISPVYNECLVYSFGINNQWTFDDAMAEFGCQVYSFDPSMGVSDHDRTQRIHFFNIGLSGRNEIHPTKGWNMKTASSIYEMLKHHHGDSALIDVMKMDIEFSEWEAIPQMLQSRFLADKVKQLSVEIHFNASDSLEKFQSRAQILKNLEATDSDDHAAGQFVRFSSRPNPWLKRLLPELEIKKGYIGFELAWYNLRYYSVASNKFS